MKRQLIASIGILITIMNTFCPVYTVFAENSYSPESQTESSWTPPELYIKAINPGYTIDGVSNVGEMIEIGRGTADPLDSLASYKISYTNSSGNSTTIVDFSEHMSLAGENILLRFASSPERELAALTYSKTIAFSAGPLQITKNDETIDSVCWTGKEGCAAAFKSANPTTLVRNLTSGIFEHQADYNPTYNPESLIIREPVSENEEDSSQEAESLPSQCRGLVFSEILSYYESLQSEQFIEFHNLSSEQILLDGCKIRYKNKDYSLNGIVKPDGYFVRYLADFKLTKNPNTSNALDLLDANGEKLDTLIYYNGQKKGTAYAFVGYDENGEELWKTTYAPTPGEPNNYQEFRTCEEGKVINEETGNCVKVASVKEKICAAGQYLNLLTGRCKKYETETGPTVCKEGYYLNEETGRCRKIKENDGADYALVPETYEEKSSFVALYAILGVFGVGLIYIIYEFRREIVKLFHKVIGR